MRLSVYMSAATAALLLAAASSATAQNRFVDGQSAFHHYGSQWFSDIGNGARHAPQNAWNGARKVWDSTPNIVKRGGVSSGVSKITRGMGTSVGRSTAAGQALGFFAFPNCAGEDC